MVRTAAQQAFAPHPGDEADALFERVGPVDADQGGILRHPVEDLRRHLVGVAFVPAQPVGRRQHAQVVMTALLPGDLDVADQRFIAVVDIAAERARGADAGGGIGVPIDHRFVQVLAEEAPAVGERRFRLGDEIGWQGVRSDQGPSTGCRRRDLGRGRRPRVAPSQIAPPGPLARHLPAAVGDLAGGHGAQALHVPGQGLGHGRLSSRSCG